MPYAHIPRSNEQRKVEALLLRLAQITSPISAKPAPIATGKNAVRIA